MADADARWYPDPDRPGSMRLWDGNRWTDHRHTPAGSSRSRVWGVPIGALLAVVAVLALVVNGTVALAMVGVALGGSADGGQRSAASASVDSGEPARQPSAGASSARATPTASSTPAPRPSASRSSSPSPTRSPASTSGALVAVAGIVDGDTIKVRIGGTTQRVRVIGIDTPELRNDECYAQQAASKMQSLVQGKQVALERDPTQSNRDRYDRLLRHVALADGRRVAEILLAGGFGEEYTYDKPYSRQQQYRAAEADARNAGRGIWSGGCRAAAAPPPAPAPTRTPAKDTSSCTIKGNIASDGERIYHVPGQRHYEQTRIDLGKGERWFCSESEAVSAGWRRAKV
ncbi:thermonuclease family protein [uncultured Phycicoccus sp.]|uniref:thermonuclease family protein n=1 Tax=uncultured Phycicoccus sp. TaxID=661422 RepID=UPI00261F44DD|nr:thermonuclease family protein [uncultured Phycicoccus sp.]